MRFGSIVVALILMPLSLGGGSLNVELDVPYASGHAAQQLDLYLPAATKAFPTVVFVHGGSLQSGDKRDGDYGKVCPAFIAQGVACATINYRMLSDAPWPAPVDDTATAFAWVRRNIESKGGDRRNIFLVGHSSGARLVATVATDEQFVKRAGFSIADIRGVVAMGSIMRDKEFEQAVASESQEQVQKAFASDAEYRAFGRPERYRDSWPLYHVHAGIPPVLFIIAEAEKFHPPVLASAEEFVAAARKLGCWADYKIVPGKHMDEVRNLSMSQDTVLQAVVQFIRARSNPQ